jgi:long-chain acyl-CoA synthetase
VNLALQREQAGRDDPQRPALAQGPRVLRSYAEFASRVARLAGALRGFGLMPGDRVAIAATNRPDYVEALYAIWHAGLAAVPVNAKLHGAELGYILDQSGARVCLASDRLDSAIAPHAPANLERMIVLGSAEYGKLLASDAIPVTARAGSDLAWLFYTSGTTGRPKGAMLTHSVLAAATQAYLSEVDSVVPGNPILHAAPMSHGSGLYSMAYVLRRGVNVVPESGGFEAQEIFALLDAWPGTSMFAAPTMVKRLVECAADCPAENIRTIVYGGAPMYVEDALKALDRFGPRLAQIYGQGESPMTITVLPKTELADRTHPRWRERLASVGRRYAYVEVKVADEQDRGLPVGEVGEVLCRGETVMAGYWQNPDASVAALRGGFLHTGDIGTFDGDGYLTLKDRSKDLIISGGSNIYPREIEEVLLKHDGVREVSVIGRPDREWGEVVVAYVVGDADIPELDSLCLASIARFKRPRHYVFVEALPKNNYGKILKTELRAMDEQRRAAGGSNISLSGNG